MADSNVIPFRTSNPSRFQQLLEKFEPAELEEVLEQIALLSSGFPNAQRSRDEVKETIKAFANVVEGFPLGPIEIAVQNFLHGTVEDQNVKFMPTAPEFSKEVRRAFCAWEYERRGK